MAPQTWITKTHQNEPLKEGVVQAVALDESDPSDVESDSETYSSSNSDEFNI